MKADFQYFTDFYGMNSYELSHTCMHLLCLAGEASFVFNEHCYHIIKNDLVVIPMPDRVRNLAGHSSPVCPIRRYDESYTSAPFIFEFSG